ncbi:MAG: hypothetical protein JST73_11985 [Actinobacteria bacterium]|nr:hypothetical protein [Actinomycetota bacterium]
MPKSVQEILDHADELAKRFEDYEPDLADERSPDSLAHLRDAALARSSAESAVVDAVDAARADGLSWATIGSVLGTSGEAARQRYGHRQTT